MRRAGVLTFVGLLAAALGMTAWFDQGTLLSGAGDVVTYTFGPAPTWWCAADIAIAALSLFAVHFFVNRAPSARHVPASSPLEELNYLNPLWLIALKLGAVALLWPALRPWWGPIGYVTADLHPVVVAIAVALCLYRIEVRSGRPARGWWQHRIGAPNASDRRFLVQAALVGGVVATVYVTSPHIRFSSETIGDEPKYIRYAENWWQGNGMAVTDVRDVSALPRGDAPRFAANLRLLGRALRTDLRDLGVDARRILNWQQPDRRFNRAEYAGNWIVKGKSGDFYQMHGPGIAVLILPAYTIDRRLFDRHLRRFSDDLFTVNLTFLTIFALLTAAVYRLLRSCDVESGTAAACAAGCALSLPVAAFAFAFYPETCAALIVCAVVGTLVAPPRGGAASALATGLLLGSLGWLHTRFLGLAVVALAWVAWRRRGRPALVVAAAAGYGVMTAALCLYVYHVSGSLLPTALYAAANSHDVFSAAEIPAGLVGLVFDRENGLMALAPVYLLALPGMGRLLRRSPARFWMIATLTVALLIPAAGHGYASDGTTPLRHVLAIVPLFALPIAEWVTTTKKRPVLFAITVVLAVISVHNAVMYDLQNDKTITAITASGISGWDTTLLFPLVRRIGWHRYERIALAFWMLVSAAGFVLGMRNEPAEAVRPATRMLKPERLAAWSLAAIAVLGVIAISADGPGSEPRLRKPPPQVVPSSPQRTAAGCFDCHSGVRWMASATCARASSGVAPAARAATYRSNSQFEIAS